MTDESLLIILDDILTKNECQMLITKCNELLMNDDNGDSKFDPKLTRKMFYSTRYYDE